MLHNSCMQSRASFFGTWLKEYPSTVNRILPGVLSKIWVKQVLPFRTYLGLTFLSVQRYYHDSLSLTPRKNFIFYFYFLIQYQNPKLHFSYFYIQLYSHLIILIFFYEGFFPQWSLPQLTLQKYSNHIQSHQLTYLLGRSSINALAK